MKRLNLSLILAILLSGTQLFGQKNFKQGAIIKTNGDTIEGWINPIKTVGSPILIYYNASQEGGTLEYFPGDILGFTVGDESYVSSAVTVEGSPFQLEELPASPDLKWRTDTAFVKRVISGPKSLYHYRDQKGKDHYFISNNDSLETLVYKKYIKRIQRLGFQRSYDTIIENKKYKGQLALYLQECKTIGDKVNSAIYSTKSLSKVFNYYYKNLK